MTTFLVLKMTHLTAVTITISLFVLRGFWIMRDSPVLAQRWVKVVPHVNDTVLLLSALGMCTIIGQYPFVHHWLTIKVVLLLVYILLGVLAIRPNRSKSVRLISWAAALCTVGLIIWTALDRGQFLLG